ncbi:class I SAM-dependent methyltransferase [Microterricola pindariensis]|uniref:SAM-dependent methyltransferase n=1 Tax=Microterricola pindariensis TaxID=478010 RepID=A0ABX5AXH1_9MICO|nr:class I SAM-dependent methyltransferase [Microterricola pindariensis]PPL19071.1 SAM-dependent methyltransferase [Microterricola pindariensis]
MTHDFDKAYWEQKHQDESHASESTGTGETPPHPYLATEIAGLTPGTALDAGCGTGAEAVWLAANGWQVTGADISDTALARATARADAAGFTDALDWVLADLTAWEPERTFELVTSSYAHPNIPQLDFYEHIARWVAPGGTLLIIGHLHDDAAGHGHGHGTEPAAHEHGGHGENPPAEATVTLADIRQRLASAGWIIETAEEHDRTLTSPGGRAVSLRDVVVRARRA